MEEGMRSKILVMYAGDYDMKDDDGKVLKGCVLQYYFWGENGERLRAVNNGSTGTVGYQRAKCSIDFDKRAKISSVPAVYDASFIMTVGSDGKPVLKVNDIDYVGDVLIQGSGLPAEKKAVGK